jgi:hypothetical protein
VAVVGSGDAGQPMTEDSLHHYGVGAEPGETRGSGAAKVVQPPGGERRNRMGGSGRRACRGSPLSPSSTQPDAFGPASLSSSTAAVTSGTVCARRSLQLAAGRFHGLAARSTCDGRSPRGPASSDLRKSLQSWVVRGARVTRPASM